MGDFVRVVAASELQPGSGMEATVDGQAIALFNVGGEFRAIGNRCIHRGGPLGQGLLEGDVVLCPWHAWGYDTQTGVSTASPEFKVPCYAVRVESGQVCVKVE